MTESDHKPKLINAGFMIDQVECSCGWKSHTYFDGREYAMGEHRKHVEEQAAEVKSLTDF